MSTLRYCEFAPAPVLAGSVDCYWSLSGPAVPEQRQQQRVFPDGHPEIAAHLGTPFRRDGAMQASALWIGQMRGVATLEPAGRVEVFGVRLKPHGAGRLGGATSGLILPLADVWPREAVDRWRSRLAEARHVTERPAITDRFLAPLLGANSGETAARARQQRVGAAVEFLSDAAAGGAGRGMLREAAARAGISERQLERTFAEYVGLPPKVFARLLRFQAALRLSEPGSARPPLPWARVAAEAGYYDQSHLVADFHEFGGAAPTLTQHDRTEMERLLVRSRRVADPFGY